MEFEITKQEIEVKQAFFRAGSKVKTFSGRIKTLSDGVLLQNKHLGTIYALTNDGFDTTIMNKKGVWLSPLSECYKNREILCDCPGQCRNSC